MGGRTAGPWNALNTDKDRFYMYLLIGWGGGVFETSIKQIIALKYPTTLKFIGSGVGGVGEVTLPMVKHSGGGSKSHLVRWLCPCTAGVRGSVQLWRKMI